MRIVSEYSTRIACVGREDVDLLSSLGGKYIRGSGDLVLDCLRQIWVDIDAFGAFRRRFCTGSAVICVC